MKITEEIRQALRKPLPQEALKPHPTKSFLTTIKPIYIIERMNDVFGIGGWTRKVELIESNHQNGCVIVKVSINIPEYEIYLEGFGGNDNGGASSKGFDYGDAFKGATTDAETKCLSYLEIGIDIFKGKVTSPKQPINPKPSTNPVSPKEEETNKVVSAFAKFDYIKQVVPVIKEVKEGNEGFKDITLYATVQEFAKNSPQKLIKEVHTKLSK